jgi:hypothetical protein
MSESSTFHTIHNHSDESLENQDILIEARRNVFLCVVKISSIEHIPVFCILSGDKYN